MTETEVVAVRGTATVESVDLRDGRTGTIAPVAATAVFVMIGADPCTEAAHGIARPRRRRLPALRQRRGRLRRALCPGR